MIKPTNNPWIIHKTRTSFDRECALVDIPWVIRSDGSKGCIWCGDDLKTQHHAQRYCKDKNCPKAAYMWGYPQREMAMAFLLNQQSLKCRDCQYDYSQDLRNTNSDFNDLATEDMVFRMKKKIDLEHRPEVDHINPIFAGGQSLGLNNHQVLCYTCHKNKTKDDFKKEKRIKSPVEIQVEKDKKTENNYYEKFSKFVRKQKTLLNKIRSSSDKNERIILWKEYQDRVKSIFMETIINEEELDYAMRRLKENDNGLEESLWAKEILEKRKGKPY